MLLLTEDYAFGDLLEEIEDDEQLTGNDAIEAYQHYLSNSQFKIGCAATHRLKPMADTQNLLKQVGERLP